MGQHVKPTLEKFRENCGTVLTNELFFVIYVCTRIKSRADCGEAALRHDSEQSAEQRSKSSSARNDALHCPAGSSLKKFHQEVRQV